MVRDVLGVATLFSVLVINKIYEIFLILPVPTGCLERQILEQIMTAPN